MLCLHHSAYIDADVNYHVDEFSGFLTLKIPALVCGSGWQKSRRKGDDCGGH